MAFMIVKKNFVALYLALFLVLLNACSSRIQQISPSQPPQQRVIEPVNRNLLLPADSAHEIYRGLHKSTRVFYQKTNYHPVWSLNDHLTARGDSMIRFIEGLAYRGLRPKEYHFDRIGSLKKNIETDSNLLQIDALLTDAFLSISTRLQYGERNRTDTATHILLMNVVKNGNLFNKLESLEPTSLGYHSLKSGLKRMLDSSTYKTPSASDDLSRRIIELNLDRWRSEPVVGDRYILINIPSFMLQLVSRDSIILESPVIVGTPDNPTPLLSSLVECFVTYPYWNVPRKIALEEYLPVIQKDSTFIRRNHFNVLDRKGKFLNADSVNWNSFNKDYFPVRLQQREGVENSLGIVKFVFDNPYAVFLHDTNAKGLFKKKIRAFSHGCVRMEKAVELAHYLATGRIDKKSSLVDKYLQEPFRHVINLKQPMPIYIRYFTCEGQNTSIRFYNDIYELDKRDRL